MSVTDGLPGEGTKLQMKVATVYTSIANIDEIDGFEITADEIEKTGLSDVIKKFRKSRVPDAGKVSIKARVDPNNTIHQSIYAKVTASTPGADDDFKIVFVDDNTTPAFATFFGFFTKYKLTGMKVNENVMVEIEIKVTSLPIMTPGVP